MVMTDSTQTSMKMLLLLSLRQSAPLQPAAARRRSMLRLPSPYPSSRLARRGNGVGLHSSAP